MIKSEDVNPPKEDSRPTKVVKKQPVKKTVASKAELVDAIKQYQDSVKEASGGRVLMKMETENMSFLTESGVKFTREAPFQLVEEWEVDLLLKQNFRKAYPEEVSEYYENYR